ncbi:hypothetical protein MTO96_007639 [Rhipicephalus appendiculatus]
MHGWDCLLHRQEFVGASCDNLARPSVLSAEHTWGGGLAIATRSQLKPLQVPRRNTRPRPPDIGCTSCNPRETGKKTVPVRSSVAMIPEVHPYTLSGFSENLDWRTLDFVKPIDDIRVCSACGFVARKTAFLPCRHVLCEPCYEQWKPEVKVCFLDGELCAEKEVHWMEFPEEKMMTREVRHT